MDVFEAVEKRRSIRKFKPDQVKKEDLKRILEHKKQRKTMGNLSLEPKLVLRLLNLAFGISQLFKDLRLFLNIQRNVRRVKVGISTGKSGISSQFHV